MLKVELSLSAMNYGVDDSNLCFAITLRQNVLASCDSEENGATFLYALRFVLAVIHVVVFFAEIGWRFEGGWGALGIFTIDLPVSIIPLLLSYVLKINPLILLLVFGTAWWFCVGILILKTLVFFSASVDEK